MKRIAAATLIGFAALAEEYPVEGNPQSTVRVIVYEDLQCSDCAVFRKMMDEQLLSKYAKRVAFEHREFPLGKHPWARKAAIAARYFASIKPELDTKFRRYAMANQMVLTTENFNEKLRGFAKSQGLDGAKAEEALNNRELAAAVERDYQDGIARGVARTPTVFVNGEPFIETFTVQEISKSIDSALAAAPGKP